MYDKEGFHKSPRLNDRLAGMNYAPAIVVPLGPVESYFTQNSKSSTKSNIIIPTKRTSRTSKTYPSHQPNTSDRFGQAYGRKKVLPTQIASPRPYPFPQIVTLDVPKPARMQSKDLPHSLTTLYLTRFPFRHPRRQKNPQSRNPAGRQEPRPHLLLLRASHEPLAMLMNNFFAHQCDMVGVVWCGVVWYGISLL